MFFVVVLRHLLDACAELVGRGLICLQVLPRCLTLADLAATRATARVVLFAFHASPFQTTTQPGEPGCRTATRVLKIARAVRSHVLLRWPVRLRSQPPSHSQSGVEARRLSSRTCRVGSVLLLSCDSYSLEPRDIGAPASSISCCSRARARHAIFAECRVPSASMPPRS